MKRTLPSLVLVVCLTAVASTAQESQHDVVRAQEHASGIDLLVVDPFGEGIPQATVTITDPTGLKLANGLTDRWGKFSVFHVLPGSYTLAIGVNSYQTYEEPLLVKEHGVADIVVTVLAERIPPPTMAAPKPFPEPAGPAGDLVRGGDSALHLIVKDGWGAVIADAGISVLQVATGAKFEGKTSQVGGFRAENLSAGSYTVTVSRYGFATRTVPVELISQRGHQITVVMQVAHTESGPPL
jgi:hypothetical protein